MKKYIISLLLFTCFSAYSQTNVSGWVTIYDHDSEAMQGDKASITLVYQSAYPTYNGDDSIMISILSPTYSGQYLFKSKSYNLSSVYNTTDTATFNIDIPNDMECGKWKIEIRYSKHCACQILTDSITIKSSTTTDIIDPINPPANISIRYFSQQGIEILKPSSGFFIWSASNGQSGKTFIMD